MESYQVSAPSGTSYLENLTELTTVAYGERKKQVFGDWATTLEKRGFEPMVKSFIQGVKDQSNDNLRQKQVFLSHELCSKIIQEHQRHVL